MLHCATLVLFAMDRMNSQGYLPGDVIQSADDLTARCLEILDLMQGPPVEHSILAVLRVASDMACSDDRDRLFALLSLGEPDLMLPDYGLSTKDTYVAFAAHMVRRGTAADIVHFAGEQWHYGRRESNLSSLGLPTWVPDLRMRTVTMFVLPKDEENSGGGRILHNASVNRDCLTAAARMCRWNSSINMQSQARSGDCICYLFRLSEGAQMSMAVVRPTKPSQPRPVSFTVVETFLEKADVLAAEDFWEQQIELY